MKFKAGDLVRVVDASGMHKSVDPTIVRFGAVGEIVGPLHQALVLSTMTIDMFWIVKIAGQLFDISETILRKIPPDPGRQVVSWDECAWSPNRSVVQA
jgi:hypothetical protein